LRGKSWGIEQERQLRELVKESVSIAEISQAMGKTRVAVRSKIYHLGLSVVDATAVPQHVAASIASVASIASTPQLAAKEKLIDCTPPRELVTNCLPLPDFSSATGPKETDSFTLQIKKDGPLPSIEEKLRVLDAALVALEKPGISRAEVARYSKIIEGVKVYNDLFAKFVNYRGLEIKVLELEKQLVNEKNQP
jgi:hypothetical protein